MNNATNNSSLVLAFEVSKGGKVLLFAGDAQAGNWRSWSQASFDDGRAKVAAKDLLGRTVLYKVGHHGSHNATLNGDLKSEHPNQLLHDVVIPLLPH
jgi:beta-lactamase superfamily II metal-dependent hydrolase